MNKTDIEYLDYSWNVTHGCSPISPGCTHCWAEGTSHRLAGMGVRGYSKNDPFKVVCCPWKLDEPLKVKKPSRIGVSFMGDLFHEDVPFDFISKVGRAITDSEYRFEDDYGYPEKHQFMILTKRPERMGKYFEYLSSGGGPLTACPIGDEIWLGVTVENENYLQRIDELLKIPATNYFVSFEPLLGPMNSLKQIWVAPENQKISWAIIGAESGPKRRKCDIQWVGDLLFQLKATNIPVFIKQLDINGKLSKNPSEWPEDLRIREYPL